MGSVTIDAGGPPCPDARSGIEQAMRSTIQKYLSCILFFTINIISELLCDLSIGRRYGEDRLCSKLLQENIQYYMGPAKNNRLPKDIRGLLLERAHQIDARLISPERRH